MHKNIARFVIIALSICVCIAVIVLVVVTLTRKENFEDSLSTIFINIASYRDSDCKNTLNDIYKKAKYPKRIFIGLCEQNNEKNKEEVCKRKTKNYVIKDNVRTCNIPYQEAKGPLYARARINQKLFKNEDYFLMLDAHTRVKQNFDVELIKQLNYLRKKGVQNPIISSYPGALSKKKNTKDDQLSAMNHGKDSSHNCKIINGDKYPTVIIANIKPGGTFQKTPLLAAGNLFTYGEFVNEVKFDSTLEHLFGGEEILIALLAFTNGWDIYSGPNTVVYHEYVDKDTPNRKNWHKEIVQSSSHERSKESDALKKLEKILFDYEFSQTYKYGIGNKRSPEDFWKNLGWNRDKKDIKDKYTKEDYWCNKSPTIDFKEDFKEELYDLESRCGVR